MKKMYKIFGIALLIFPLAFAAPVSVLANYGYLAQQSYGRYQPSFTAQPSYSTSQYPVYGNCVTLTNNLFRGSTDAVTGGQVSRLQAFLISQNYLRIAVPSGYYGVLTAQAVAEYQRSHGIPPDGNVGIMTRNSIQNISCGGGYDGYPYDNGNYYAPHISSLSDTSGQVGDSISIFGTGFDLYDNTVNFDGIDISGVPSYAGTAIAFVVPHISGYRGSSRTYSISVSTNRGTSNSILFRLTGANYDYDYCNGYYNSDDDDCDNDFDDLELDRITPSSGDVGIQVTLRGSGFTSRNNTVHFGIGGKRNVSSSSGTSIRFTIPSSVGPCDLATGQYRCAAYQQRVEPGLYPVYVSDSNGNSETVYFNVTD